MAEDYEYKGTAEPEPVKVRKVFRPDWRVTIFAIACFIFLLNLGTWQVNRYYESIELGEYYATRHDKLPPITALSEHTGDDRVDTVQYRRGELTGVLLPDEIHLLTARYKFKEPGYGILVPMRVEGAKFPKILIDRGWVPRGKLGEYLKAIKARPSEPVTLKGRLQASPDIPLTPSGEAILEPVREVEGHPAWRNTNPRVISKYVDGLDPLIFLKSGEQASGKYIDIDDYPLDGYRNPVRMAPAKHVEYAITWYGVAAALVGVWVAFSFQAVKREEDEPAPETSETT